MSKRQPHTLQTEPTPEGEQTLIPGIRPITTRDRLTLLANAPLRPRGEQEPLYIGFLDESARSQLDLFSRGVLITDELRDRHIANGAADDETDHFQP
ncbi:hypothetical protein [Mesorhizobium sp. M0678]|uniref:hypothetical protein n=1 Tax=Mesorhizobium sp. M0678 TaxID=2956985 RepID=UPI00333A624E